METGGFQKITKQDIIDAFPGATYGNLVDGRFVPSDDLTHSIYGLEVLRANPSCDLPSQHGWSELFIPLKKLKLSRRYKTIQGIRGLRRGCDRQYFFDLKIIDENDVYAWFYDLVWRQNNNSVVIKDENGNKKVIEDTSGRWNKKKPFGYQVRKRLRNVLEEIKNPVLLTLTISDKNIYPLMPNNTNMDVVMYSIANYR